MFTIFRQFTTSCKSSQAREIKIGFEKKNSAKLIQQVEQVMEDLRITKIANTKIGNSQKRGISGGEKRRVSIAMELVISPSILFLDEVCGILFFVHMEKSLLLG